MDIDNPIWGSFLAIYKASEDRASMTCKDLGY